MSLASLRGYAPSRESVFHTYCSAKETVAKGINSARNANLKELSTSLPSIALAKIQEFGQLVDARVAPYTQKIGMTPAFLGAELLAATAGLLCVTDNIPIVPVCLGCACVLTKDQDERITITKTFCVATFIGLIAPVALEDITTRPTVYGGTLVALVIAGGCFNAALKAGYCRNAALKKDPHEV